jgi:hypothetical protein
MNQLLNEEHSSPSSNDQMAVKIKLYNSIFKEYIIISPYIYNRTNKHQQDQQHPLLYDAEASPIGQFLEEQVPEPA